MKMRLDALLVEKKLVTGRDKAKAVIMAGLVYIDNQKADKPGLNVDPDCNVEVRGEKPKYVSRGGLKLEKAMAVFPLELAGTVCIDIGASTGGFTDCMLQNGAAKVYAIDVGYGQLAWNLRTDERVVVLERTNIRHVTREQVPEEVDFASVDVSFISLTLVLPVAYMLLRDGGQMVCLVKPQFEAGRERVGKKGVVRDSDTHVAVLQKIVDFAADNGFCPLGLNFSPVTGPEGNIEYLLHVSKSCDKSRVDMQRITQTVADSHQQLQKGAHPL